MHFSNVKVYINEIPSEKLVAFFNETLEPNPPPLKRQRLTLKHGENILDQEFYSEDYLTIAKVDLDLYFPCDGTEDVPALRLFPKVRKQLSAVLKTFKPTSNDRYHCHIATSDGITLIDADLNSCIDPQTLEVLAKAAEMSVSRRKSNAIGVAWMILDLRQDQRTWDRALTFRVKILIHNSKDLAEGSLKSRSLLNLCAPQANSQIWEAWSPPDFYDSVFVPDKQDSAESPRMDQLRCELYPFQARALRWLLEREGVAYNGTRMVTADTGDISSPLPHGFVRTIDGDGRDCFISHFLGVMSTERHLVQRSYAELKGGILAEEMGLGKTVEICALVCLHRQQTSVRMLGTLSDPAQNTAATLIITPSSILKQWKNELHALSPELNVMIYEGIRREAVEHSHQQMIQLFRHHDVVLTTYSVLAAEIHYAPVPARDLRHEKKYERRVSPVTQITWWRVVLDEAQMIENGLNNAAKVAQLIPRQNAWAVSGTPVKKDARDLLGLLVFLRFEPFCQSPQLWDYLVIHHRDIFKGIFRALSLRHTKEQIKDEIKLPPQNRVVITIPFTQIEEQHYSTVYQQMCEDCGLDLDGCPLTETWDPKSSVIIEKMRSWLTRLRQTCLHPEVGSRNRRALGSGRGPLRTVGEVLEVMIEQNVATSRAEERALLLSQIRRGQLLEHANRSKEALNIWLHTLKESKALVEDCRQQKPELDQTVVDESQRTENPGSGPLTTARTGVHRQRLRSALEMEHMSTFFVANAYYQIKIDLNITEPDSIAFQNLDKLEEDAYERAKTLRKEMLIDTHKKAEACMNSVKEKMQDKSYIRLPSITLWHENGGIESRNVIVRSNNLLRVLNAEASQIDEWRETLIGLLLLPLVDEDDAKLQGDEYEASKKQQDAVYVYMDALRSLVADRHTVLTGQNNDRIDHEMRFALEKANGGEGHAPTLLKRLLSTREQLKLAGGVGSLRGIVTELRDLKASFRIQAENGNTRASAELAILHTILQNLHDVSVKQIKSVAALDRELELFKDTMNSRLEYYRQLQQISDTVAPYEPSFDKETLATTLATMQDAEKNMRDRLAVLKARARYLVHLRDELTLSGSQRLCIICQQPFEVGVLTSCGHSYCVECLRLWWGVHRNCPTCKKRLSRNDFHQITYKPKEFILEEESQPKDEGAELPAKSSSQAIYSGIRDVTLAQIKNIDIDGSFGTKIDTLARHMLWIRANDPGAKSIVFSQFRDFLDVLAKAFTQFKIAFTGIDRKDGTQVFKEDASLECFFLHAKAHSSGLNLVNATHVFLCEPLINTAIELQAIARVHRIGQHHPTTVWMYLVENTVERSIYEISVNRRMSHLSQPSPYLLNDIEVGNLTESDIEAANTRELQTPFSNLLTKGSGGGEMVSNDDLWDCLFRQRPEKSIRMLDEDHEVSRGLRASAAEVRLRVSGGNESREV